MARKTAIVLIIILACMVAGYAESSSGTPQNATDAAFDYDSIIDAPDDYVGEEYLFFGIVEKNYSSDIESRDDITHNLSMISVDGDIKKTILLSSFQWKAEPIITGKRVAFRATFKELTQIKSAIGFYITLPLFEITTALKTVENE